MSTAGQEEDTGEGESERVEVREEEWTRHAVKLLLCRGGKLHLCLHSSVNIRMETSPYILVDRSSLVVLRTEDGRSM